MGTDELMLSVIDKGNIEYLYSDRHFGDHSFECKQPCFASKLFFGRQCVSGTLGDPSD
jgi:hypothetical protein